jgi:uncharacterized protein (DUF362 family)
METVSILHRNNPTEKDIYEMVEKSIDLIGGFSVYSGDSILVKPNLVTSKKYYTGATTDPRIIEAVIIILKRMGAKNITIAEGSWTGCDTERAFEATGVKHLAKKYDVKLVDLKKDEHIRVKIPKGKAINEILIAKTVLETDKTINLPKIKAHGNTTITISLKNLKGYLPDKEKTRFHRIGLSQAIADLNTVLKNDLIVVDGIIGERTAELGCDPIELNVIIAGKNPVAVDAVCVEFLGYRATEIEHIVLASKHGLGSYDVKDIRVVGDIDYFQNKEWLKNI